MLVLCIICSFSSPLLLHIQLTNTDVLLLSKWASSSLHCAFLHPGPRRGLEAHSLGNRSPQKRFQASYKDLHDGEEGVMILSGPGQSTVLTLSVSPACKGTSSTLRSGRRTLMILIPVTASKAPLRPLL